MVTRPDQGRVIQRGYAQTQSAEIDAGLRTHMQKVYGYMAGGLAITGAISYFVGNNEVLLQAIYGTPLAWVVMFAPLVFAFIFGMRIHAMSSASAQILFWVFAGVMGLSLSYIFAVYTDASIVRTFFISAGTFLAMSLYGYTTKRDLSGMGSFLIMGVFGLILAMLVNLFLQSSALQFAISAIGVLVFAGLTAYDTQKIKESYFEGDAAVLGRNAIMGALTLYLDFINMFQFLLSFLGDRD